MGKKKGNNHPVIGYGYGFEFVYGFCEQADYCSGYKMKGVARWYGWATNGMTINKITGERGDVQSSSYTGVSSIRLWMGNSVPSGIPSGMYYKNTVLAHFHNGQANDGNTAGAFVGDNSRAIPEYQFRFERYNVSGIPANNSYRKIRNGLNPVFIIGDLLVNQLNIPVARLDAASFTYAGDVMWNEGLGMSIIITKAKKVKEWIEDILRYMDAVLYYDNNTQKYVLRILRKDYDISTLPLFDEEVINDLVFEKGSWSSVVSTFTFKYSNSMQDLVDTYTITNQAAIQVNGYENAKTFDFTHTSDFTSLAHIIPRVVSKHGKPGGTAKFKVNFMLGSTVRPGDVIKLKNIKTDYSTVMRVTKVGADKVDSPYVEITAVIDIYSSNYSYDPAAELPPPPPPADPQVADPYFVFIQPLPEESLTGMAESDLDDKPMTTVAVATNPNDAVNKVRTEDNSGGVYKGDVWNGATIVSASKAGFQNFTEIGFNRDFVVILDNSLGRFTSNVTQSEEQFQSGRITLTTSRSSSPTIIVKNLEVLGYDSATGSYENSTVRLTGFADLLNDDASTWYTGPISSQHAVNWGSDYANMVYIRINKPLTHSEIYLKPGTSQHCRSSSYPKETLKVAFENNYYLSGSKTVEINDCYQLWKAYKVSGIKYQYNGTAGDEHYVVLFRPTHPGEGASFQDCDSWTGATEEALAYGRYAIVKVTSGGSITSVAYDINVAHADSDGYIRFNIPKDEAEGQHYWGIYNYFDGFGHGTADNSYLKAGRGIEYFTI